MKIISLSFENKARKWSLNKADFENLTLLVGASGVGKTQILKSIMKIKSIANGKSLSGLKWDILVELIDGDRYQWNGEFDVKGDGFLFDMRFDDEDEKKRPSIINEKIILNGNDVVVVRENDDIQFEGNKTVKLSNKQSVVYLLKEEEVLKPLFDGFNKITYNDLAEASNDTFKLSMLDARKLFTKKTSIECIQESDEHIIVKMFLAYKNAPMIFEKIKNRYMDIFPQIEDVKVEPLNIEDLEDLPVFLIDMPFIQIKEKGVEEWILQSNISSGMLRSLIHIGEIYLCRESSVFLIDEFENSLGINCINEITEDIINTNRKIQFILTSHHPYIINSIASENWKLVTRSKGVVTTHKSDKFQIGKSKHDAFMQLLQLDEYQTGLE